MAVGCRAQAGVRFRQWAGSRLRTQAAGKCPCRAGIRLSRMEGPWSADDQAQDPSWLPGPEWVGETLGVFTSIL